MLVMPQRNRKGGIQYIDLLNYTKLRQLQQICLIFAMEYTIDMCERHIIKGETL